MNEIYCSLRKVDPLSTFESLQTTSSRDFPAVWYDSAPEDHFWMTWRLRVILEHLRRLSLEGRAEVKAFDIGCGHGAFQRQMRAVSSWTIDGCDLNENAISLSRGHNGGSFLYNIFELRKDLQHKYDVVFLLDVIENIQNPVEFLSTARFYMKRGGYMVINVPAIPVLYSKYDVAVGHIRRYTKHSLSSELSAAELTVETVTYWGLSLVILAALRKAALAFIKPQAVIRRGFVPPSIIADKILRLVMSAELAMARDVPYGASLLAIVREATS